jgi:surface antigen
VRALPTYAATLICLVAFILVPQADGSSSLPVAASDLGVEIAEPQASDNDFNVTVHLRTGLPRQSCTGRATLGGRSSRLIQLTTSATEGAQWRWLTAINAPAGILTVSVSCIFPDAQTVVGTDSRYVPAGPHGRPRYQAPVKRGSLRGGAWNPPKRTKIGRAVGEQPSASTTSEPPQSSTSGAYPTGQSTAYVAARRQDLPYFPGSSGNALNWARTAEKRGFPTGSYPQVGAVAVFQPGQYGAGIYGHVAYVVAVNNSRMTVHESHFADGRHLSIRTIPWYGLRFIYKRVISSVPPATVAQLTTIPTSSPGPPPPTFVETAGGPANTWSDYRIAGGVQGPTVDGFRAISVACKLTGFMVEDGNTWWYLIASAPWNRSFYVTADAFYNNGQTSGSLHGTPFVDNQVPDCPLPSSGGR